MKRKILFRADASATIGYGHFIRSLALADMLKEDFDCTIFTQEPTEYQKQEVAKICKWEPLPADDSKFEIFLEKLTGTEIVVLDNYFFTTEYQKQIKAKGCPLVCIDDMHDKHYVADVVINHGCRRAELFSIEPYTQLCLGLEWALLRRPFLEATPQAAKNSQSMENVAICFGGSDPHDLTARFITQLLAHSHVQQVKAIVGEAYRPSNGFINDSRLQYLSKLTAEEMASVFSHSDWVICSASSVCIEALACGAKVAAGWYVDNQQEYYKYVEDRYLHFSLGNLLQPQAIQQFQLLLDNIAVPAERLSLFITHDIRSKYVNLFNSL